MPRAEIYDETTAAELAGFTNILCPMAQRALGATQRPEYDVYRERTTETLSEN